MRFTLLACLGLAACTGRGEHEDRTFSTGAPAPTVQFDAEPEAEGLQMRLYDAEGSAPPAGEALRQVQGTPLSDSAVQKLLTRVPDLDAEHGDRQTFALRDGSPPPPRTGADVQQPFPPPPGSDAPTVATGPLEVLRFAPEGEVPMAPHLSVTFSQPMVAVTSQEQASKTVPVTMTPEPEGRWRWLGTKTLLFDPDPRLPMATEYTVEVPAGTTSATGSKLGEAFAFTFATPAPVMTTVWPTEPMPQPLSPVIVVGFDQAIDPAAVAEHITLSGGGTHPLRLTTPDELAADDVAARVAEAQEPGRWVALVPDPPLPRATSFKLTVGKGTPSAEGPRTSTGDQSGHFSTYAPLQVVEHHCYWDDVCPPTSGWMVRFNNPLDAQDFDPTEVRVEPAVPGFSVQPQGDTLSITGAFTGRTVYKLVLPASVPDTFDQTLGAEQTLTFEVGPAEPTLSAPGDHLVVLDPSGGAVLPVWSTNHQQLKVKVSRVDPEHWTDWIAWQEHFYYEDARPKRLPGTMVHQGWITPPEGADRRVETALDLSEWLDDDGHGHLIVLIEPARQPREAWNRQYVARWVQGTDIGLTAFTDATKLVGWATELGSGEPLADVTLSITDGSTGTTGRDGLAELALTSASPQGQALVARRGDDVALLPADAGWWGGAHWVKTDELDHMRWYVTDDRGLYKPGETARVMGWMRTWGAGPSGDVGPLDPVPTAVSWTLSGARGNELAKGEASVSALGGFTLDVELPGDANLGTAWLHLVAQGPGPLHDISMSHPVQIQEFRRPEFEVTASAGAGPFLLGEDATVDLTAAYYAGGGLPGADVSWSVRASPGAYVPPGRSDFSFGAWSPWWMPWYGPQGAAGTYESLQATTDAAGEHHLGIHFASLTPARPMTVVAQGTVQDVNRQGWTANTTLLVHPSTAYVGLRTERAFVEKGVPIEVDVVAVDLDGEPLPDAAITLEFVRLEGTWRNGRWQEEALDPQDCNTTAADDGTAQCTFETVRGGTYRVRATVHDTEDRPNQSELRVWVTGGEIEPARNVELEQVTLVPEAQSLQPGDTARLLVQSPFSPAEGVMTVRRSGLVRTERFTLTEATTTLEVPILEGHVPDVTVQVDLVGTAPRLDDAGEARDDLPRRVAHATGSVTFEVPPLSRTLTVTATPAAAALSPGSDTTVQLEVRDAAGDPVGDAELAVVIADESVLALTGFVMPDPLDIFYAARGPGVADRRLRTHVALANPEQLKSAEPPPPPMESPGQSVGDVFGGSVRPTAVSLALDEMNGSEGKSAPMKKLAEKTVSRSRDLKDGADNNMPMTASLGYDDGGAITMRADFSATALFAPGVRTDGSGRATVPLTVPDSLTRYRVMVVVVDDDQGFGSAEAAITARLPLMVRPSAPRFLNFGDQLELPIVLQNQTDEAMTVDLAVRGTNLHFIDKVQRTVPDLPDVGVSSAGRQVQVPANDRVEVRFPAATIMAGTVRLQAVGATRGASDAATLSLPVWTPATTEAFATYGEIDDGGIVQPVAAPPGVWTQFGGLDISTSSTQLQALTDAVLYLQTYPYDCNEQLASRLLAIASLRDVLSAFEADGLPPSSDLEAQVQADLKRLAQRQNYDGGFAFWRKGDPSWPFLSIHVANAFARSKAKGYDVPRDAWNRSAQHIRDIERHIPSWYGQRTKWFLRAYAIDVQRRMGEADVGKARRLYAEAGTKGLGIDALAFLLPTLQEGGATSQVDEILRYLGNNVAESAAGAHFVTGYDDGAHVLLHSDRRADGIVLESLIEVAPDGDLIPKVVRGLLAHKKRGRWGNTQENAFVLLALDRYFRVFEKETPDFVARAWLGDGYIGDHEFEGRSTERAQVTVPMGYLTETKGSQDLTLIKDGDDGRLYYRIGVRYAPRDLRLQAADYGFAVDRTYEPIDDPGDVRKDADGVWHVRAGAQVRVRVTMAAEMRRYHVALVDPLPAGFEALNPALATTGALPADPSALTGQRFWWWSRTWYEHENLRDERVEAFASLLWDGVHEYTYVARATTPGRFVVPPSKAEEMYAPETFGRGATDIVVVE